MIRSMLFRLDGGIRALTADLEKHASEGYLPQISTLIPIEDGAPALLVILVQYADPAKPAETIPTTEIPLAAKVVEVPGNGGSHP